MTLLLILTFTFLGSIASLLGTLFLFLKKEISETFSSATINFAAGVLIATAFLDLLPEALEVSGGADIFIPAVIGFMVFFFAERFVHLFHYHHEHTDNGRQAATPLILLGDGLHNFIDGVAISVSFLTNAQLGILTTVAVGAHEIPQEIADMGILLSNKVPKKRALFLNFLSSLTAIFGALLAFFFRDIIVANLYFFLSLTAGFFIYISASDLIPNIHERFLKDKSSIHTLIFILGILVVLTFSKLFGV